MIQVKAKLQTMKPPPNHENNSNTHPLVGLLLLMTQLHLGSSSFRHSLLMIATVTSNLLICRKKTAKKIHNSTNTKQ